MNEQTKVLAQNRRQAKDHIRFFIQKHWDDEKLAAVYAFNRDGKMSYEQPCECILGVTLAGTLHSHGDPCFTLHYVAAKDLQDGDYSELGYASIGWFDFKDYRIGEINPAYLRRIRMSAILRAEMRKRDKENREMRLTAEIIVQAVIAMKVRKLVESSVVTP